MNRRTLLTKLATGTAGVLLAPGAFGLIGAGPATAQTASSGQMAGTAPATGSLADLLSAPWAAWKAAYLAKDGRVVDVLQKGASHSESQGYGLLLSAIMEDDETFDLIYRWTETNLAIRSDALLAWRWLPTGLTRVPDRNNASDGDLFYAWGLVTRARRGGRSDLIDRAAKIARTLVDKCVIQSPDGSGRLLLAPAEKGFQQGSGMVINPSYFMPRAMREIADATGVNTLATCASDGEALMSALAAGGLVPDWVLVSSSGVTAAPGKSFRNGYEAMRVALYLIWSGSGSNLAVTQQSQAYRQAAMSGQTGTGEYATILDRTSGKVLETSPNVGYGALAAFVNCAVDTSHGAPIPFYQTNDQPYYPATLHLMTLIAQIQSASTCEPI